MSFHWKYSPDQARDDHGRFAPGGGSGGGGGGIGSSGGGGSTGSGSGGSSRARLQRAVDSSLTNAAKILAAAVVIAGGVAHFQAYMRRLQ